MSNYSWSRSTVFCFVLLVSFGLSAGFSHANESKPNVVLILVDDMGAQDLGCYGSTFYETPNIDALAKQGAKFTTAYAACPVCSPTRAALMTGENPARVRFTGHITAILRHRYPKHGAIVPPDDNQKLPHEEVTIAELLGDAGYTSMSIGKWHLGPEGYWPTDHGFDVNIAGWTHGAPPAYFFPYYNLQSGHNKNIPTLALENGKPGNYLTDRLTTEAIQFIEQKKEKPFFLYLPYYAVHAPFEAKVGLVNKYNEKLKTDTSQKNATYAAMVDNLDQCVGRIMQALHKSGQDENTIFVLTSDNGGLSLATNNAPLREGKGFLYEGGIRVPMLIRYPGHIEAGSQVDTPASTTDLFATICGLANVSVPEKVAVDSLNLVPALNGKAEKNRALHWYYPHYAPQAKMPGAVIRQGDWKLIEFYDPPHVELYNLSQDVSEKNDLASSMPELTSQMNQQLHTWLKSVDPIMHTANPDYQP